MKKIKELVAYMKIWLDLYWVEFLTISIVVVLTTLIVVAIIVGGTTNG